MHTGIATIRGSSHSTPSSSFARLTVLFAITAMIVSKFGPSNVVSSYVLS